MDLQRGLSVTLNNLGQLSKVAGNSAGARGFFSESLEILRTLVAQDPGRADLWMDLAFTYWNQYQVAERDDERQWLEQVLDTLRPLREQGLLHGQLDQLWELATEAMQGQSRASTEFDNGTRQSPRRGGRKIGRNESCPCGSGKKFKHCHGRGY